jgi:hypothetical protein
MSEHKSSKASFGIQELLNGHGYADKRQPLWSSDQSFWLEIQGSRVRFPVLSDFLRSRGSGTESTQPREDN